MKDFEISGKTLVKYQGAGGDVVIPDSVTRIASDAFCGSAALRSVTVPASVSDSLWCAFRGCTGLTSVKIESRVREIEEVGFAFRDGEYVSVALPPKTVTEGIKAIGGYTFQGCESLTSVTLPDTLTEIYRNTFEGCTALISITLPASVKRIHDGAFSGCSSLKEIALPDSVEMLCGGVFANCSSLESVTLGRGVDRILDGAFSGCSSLASLTIPASVRYISGSALRDCPSLARVCFEDGENWCRISLEQGSLSHFEDGGEAVDVTDSETAASILRDLGGDVLFKKKEAYRRMPRFVTPASEPSEDTLAAAGRYFAYFTPDADAEAALLEQAKRLFIRCEGVTHCESEDGTEYSTETYLKRTPLSDLHSLKDPCNDSGYNGELLVEDGALTGVVLLVDVHPVQSPYGDRMIPLSRTAYRDDDGFSVFYVDGSVIGKRRRELGVHTYGRAEDTVETLSLTGEGDASPDEANG